MTFWKRYGRGLIWLTIVVAALAAAYVLSGCQTRYEPPGQDLWLYAPKTQPNRL